MNISRRFYANRATQRHQTVEAKFGTMHVDNIFEQIKFSIQTEEGYMKLSLTAGEAHDLSEQLRKMASICCDNVLKSTNKKEATNG